MTKPCDCDPWAGGLISHGRHEQLEELQRRFEALAKGDFGFSVQVVLENGSPRLAGLIKRVAQASEEQKVALVVEELTR